MIQLEWWMAPETWIGFFLFIVLPLVFIVWLVSKSCKSQATPTEYSRPAPPPADGSDGISAAHGADMSYYPAEEGGSKGGLPVSGLGPSGRGSYGSRPRDKDE